jgi:hypothetical protein
MKPAELEVHIGKLVLHGFSAVDRHRVGEALERELSRLFVERGVPRSLLWSDEAQDLDGGTFEARPDLGAEEIGVRVARTVYRGLRR